MVLMRRRQLAICDLLLLTAVKNLLAYADDAGQPLWADEWYCSATNAELGAVIGSHEKHVSRILNKLQRLGLLAITTVNFQRRLTPTFD